MSVRSLLDPYVFRSVRILRQMPIFLTKLIRTRPHLVANQLNSKIYLIDEKNRLGWKTHGDILDPDANGFPECLCQGLRLAHFQ